ncbi:hypothetical protein HPB51_015668 [Rhipicephalus microplus]|uniref:Uncharacterized protein n=1 Tax=Rhipicephalus microplus TaxID=6941 RepID=A0A9J6D5K5_RHIMP|nr:hypothetical protein HPB51_015668 [Rhipicephalus microplus]
MSSLSCSWLGREDGTARTRTVPDTKPAAAAQELKTKKQRDANTSIHSMPWKLVSSMDKLRQCLSHKIEALRVKRPAEHKHKNNKQAIQPAAKSTQNKQQMLSQESLAAASNIKAEKTPQGADAFYRVSYVVCSTLKLTDSSTSTDAQPNLDNEEEVICQRQMKAERVKPLKKREMCHAKRATETRNCH